MNDGTAEPDNNETLQTIARRRSVRGGFRIHPLPSGIVRAVVRAGLSAPSSKNSQPWRLHVVTSRDLIDRLAVAMRNASAGDSYVPADPLTGKPHPGHVSTVRASADIVAAVPLVIVVEGLGAFSRLADANDGRQSAPFGLMLDGIAIGACVQNMWLAATSLGLAGTFLADIAVAADSISPELGVRGDLVGALALGESAISGTPPMNDPVFTAVERVVWHGYAPC